MYEKGLLKITIPLCAEALADEDGFCERFDASGEEHLHEVRDSRAEEPGGVGTAYLPHSCDEWTIGGASEIEAMIADLQEALVKIK